MRWNRLRGPWICLLDAFYYHSDGLERPSIASGRVGEFLVSYRPLGTRINSRSVLKNYTARRYLRICQRRAQASASAVQAP